MTHCGILLIKNIILRLFCTQIVYLTFRKDERFVVSIWKAGFHEGQDLDHLRHAGPAGDTVAPALVHQLPQVVGDLVDALGPFAAVLCPLDLLSVVAAVVERQLAGEDLPHDDGEAEHVTLLRVVVAFTKENYMYHRSSK